MILFLRAICVCGLLALTTNPTFAQIATPADIETFFDEKISALKEGTGVPGITLSVVKDGEVIILKGYGVADIRTQEPVDPETTGFRVGSITKPFTAVAALQLADSGKMDLFTDLNTYLSPYQIPETYPEPVAAHHVLTHQSGFDVDISYLWGDRFGAQNQSAEEIQRRLIRIRAPGRVASYDNIGFGVLGLAIERVSGQKYENYVRANIFEPLGMTSSYVGLPPEQIESLAGCHLWSSPTNVFPCEHVHFSSLLRSAGAAVSTASDMAKFMVWLLGAGTRATKPNPFTGCI